MTDKLHDLQHRFGEAIGDLQSGLRAARRLAEELDQDKSAAARSLLWAIKRAEADAERIDALHDELDLAIMDVSRGESKDAA